MEIVRQRQGARYLETTSMTESADGLSVRYSGAVLLIRIRPGSKNFVALRKFCEYRGIAYKGLDTLAVGDNGYKNRDTAHEPVLGSLTFQVIGEPQALATLAECHFVESWEFAQTGISVPRGKCGIGRQSGVMPLVLDHKQKKERARVIRHRGLEEFQRDDRAEQRAGFERREIRGVKPIPRKPTADLADEYLRNWRPE